MGAVCAEMLKRNAVFQCRNEEKRPAKHQRIYHVVLFFHGKSQHLVEQLLLARYANSVPATQQKVPMSAPGHNLKRQARVE